MATRVDETCHWIYYFHYLPVWVLLKRDFIFLSSEIVNYFTWSYFYFNWNFGLLLCVLPVSPRTFLYKPRIIMRTANRSQFRPPVLLSCWINSLRSMALKAVRISVFQSWSPLDTLPGRFLVNSREIFRSRWPSIVRFLLPTLPLKTLLFSLHSVCVCGGLCACLYVYLFQECYSNSDIQFTVRSRVQKFPAWPTF